MAQAYSQDLRDRVIDAGTSARSAAERFGIGVATAIVWVRRAHQGERTARRQGQPKGSAMSLPPPRRRPSVNERRLGWLTQLRTDGAPCAILHPPSRESLVLRLLKRSETLHHDLSHSFQPHEDTLSRCASRKHFFSLLFDMRCNHVHGFGWAQFALRHPVDEIGRHDLALLYARGEQVIVVISHPAHVERV